LAGPSLHVGQLLVPDPEPHSLAFCIRRPGLERCFDDRTGRIQSVVVGSQSEARYSFPGSLDGVVGDFADFDGRTAFPAEFDDSFLDILLFRCRATGRFNATDVVEVPTFSVAMASCDDHLSKQIHVNGHVGNSLVSVVSAKVAVVMPIYNAERFLNVALESLLNQSLKEIKVICVDDASPDNCRTILEAYSKRDNRIIVLKHATNQGCSLARNTGIDYIVDNLPEVEYIAFMDADDRIEPDAYERAYSEAKNFDVDILNFNFLPSTAWQYKTVPSGKPLNYENNCIEAIFEHAEFYTYVVCWSKLYKRDLLNNMRFSNLRFFEDGSFAYKVLPRAKRMRVIPDILYVYNIENQESLCTKISGANRLHTIFTIIKETCEDWRKLGIFEKYKYKYISHILAYAALVCPDVIDGNYTEELNDSFGLNVSDSEILNHLPEETKNQIFRMMK
jgi:glycosyltransferase involved in cell wall biosynthesis